MKTKRIPKNIFISIGLIIISWILVPLLSIITIIGYTIICIITFKFKKLSFYLYNAAISTDQVGNSYCFPLLNKTLIKKGFNHSFGNPDETVSGVLGKNKRDNNLTKFGLLMDIFLEKLDNNHTLKSIEDDESF